MADHSAIPSFLKQNVSPLRRRVTFGTAARNLGCFALRGDLLCQQRQSRQSAAGAAHAQFHCATPPPQTPIFPCRAALRCSWLAKPVSAHTAFSRPREEHKRGDNIVPTPRWRQALWQKPLSWPPSVPPFPRRQRDRLSAGSARRESFPLGQLLVFQSRAAARNEKQARPVLPAPNKTIQHPAQAFPVNGGPGGAATKSTSERDVLFRSKPPVILW